MIEAPEGINKPLNPFQQNRAKITELVHSTVLRLLWGNGLIESVEEYNDRFSELVDQLCKGELDQTINQMREAIKNLELENKKLHVRASMRL